MNISDTSMNSSKKKFKDIFSMLITPPTPFSNHHMAPKFQVVAVFIFNEKINEKIVACT